MVDSRAMRPYLVSMLKEERSLDSVALLSPCVNAPWKQERHISLRPRLICDLAIVTLHNTTLAPSHLRYILRPTQFIYQLVKGVRRKLAAQIFNGF
ncbi:hypothetical protein E2C01_013993 [Portunus trituberculatus]|uniref:Uncharacterized protein n=1 Tax=Portunus trituberculatus TaxID=210409 RepID=A0A5B7DI13_PORTR|nr:hypothetical protein [Portunus trituberculatus]